MKTSGKEIFEWMGELAIIHVTGVETDDCYCMVELYASKAGSPPWHIHHREDKAFYIIEGVVTIHVGDVIHKAKAGDYVMARKGSPIKYTVDSKGYARIMIICTPPGFENLVRAVGTPVKSIRPTVPDREHIDYGLIISVAAEYGVEFIAGKE